MDFHNINSYSSTLTTHLSCQRISTSSWSRPVHSRFSSVIYNILTIDGFIDLRHIGDTPHLWGAFGRLVIIQQYLRSLSAVFTELSTYLLLFSMQIGVLRGRFRALPLHSTTRIASSLTKSASKLCSSTTKFLT